MYACNSEEHIAIEQLFDGHPALSIPSHLVDPDDACMLVTQESTLIDSWREGGSLRNIRSPGVLSEGRLILRPNLIRRLACCDVLVMSMFLNIASL